MSEKKVGSVKANRKANGLGVTKEKLDKKLDNEVITIVSKIHTLEVHRNGRDIIRISFSTVDDEGKTSAYSFISIYRP